jgi:hypothetical protein
MPGQYTDRPGAPSPIVEINGTSAGASVAGLTITGSGVTARGLVDQRAPGGAGLSLSSAATSAVLQGNWIGLQTSGTAARGNGGNGIDMAAPTGTIGRQHEHAAQPGGGQHGCRRRARVHRRWHDRSGELDRVWIGRCHGPSQLGSHSVSMACTTACTLEERRRAACATSSPRRHQRPWRAGGRQRQCA